MAARTGKLSDLMSNYPAGDLVGTEGLEVIQSGNNFGATVNQVRGQVVVFTGTGGVTLGDYDQVFKLKKGTGAATSLTLPTPTTDRRITVKDAKGDALINNITVIGTIDGGSSFVMNLNYQANTFVFDTTTSEWSVL